MQVLGYANAYARVRQASVRGEQWAVGGVQCAQQRVVPHISFKGRLSALKKIFIAAITSRKAAGLSALRAGP